MCACACIESTRVGETLIISVRLFRGLLFFPTYLNYSYYLRSFSILFSIFHTCAHQTRYLKRESRVRGGEGKRCNIRTCLFYLSIHLLSITFTCQSLPVHLSVGALISGTGGGGGGNRQCFRLCLSVCLWLSVCLFVCVFIWYFFSFIFALKLRPLL